MWSHRLLLGIFSGEIVSLGAVRRSLPSHQGLDFSKTTLGAGVIILLVSRCGPSQNMASVVSLEAIQGVTSRPSAARSDARKWRFAARGGRWQEASPEDVQRKSREGDGTPGFMENAPFESGC